MPSRRLDQHIRELCRKVILAPENEFEPAILDLKNALREHTAFLRRLAAEQLAGVAPMPTDPPESPAEPSKP